VFVLFADKTMFDKKTSEEELFPNVFKLENET
jgi:hypothetical protein